MNDYAYSNDFGYYGDMYYNSSDEAAIALVLIMFAALTLVCVAGYFVRAFGLYNMAKKQNVPNPWLAFIPIASNYLEGDLAGTAIPVGKKTMNNPALWMLLAPIIVSVVMTIGYISFLLFGAIFVMVAAASDSVGLLMLGMMAAILVFMLVVVAATAALYAVQGLVRVNIYKKYTDDSVALVHMLLGMFIPLYSNIYFAILGKRYPKDYIPPVAEEEYPPYEGDSF